MLLNPRCPPFFVDHVCVPNIPSVYPMGDMGDKKRKVCIMRFHRYTLSCMFGS